MGKRYKKIRPRFNIHTITSDIERRDKENYEDRNKAILLSKNVEIMCLGCGHKFYVAFYTLNGVKCPLCRRVFRINPYGTNIRDSTLNDKELKREGEYRIGFKVSSR